MIILYVGLLIFFGLHFYSAFRSRSQDKDIKIRLGEAKYMGLYSIGSALGLGLIIWGYMKAPVTAYLLNGIAEARPINIGLMLIAFVLLVASQLPAGHIKRKLVHPMLIGVALWAIAHLIDGANLKQVLLFGSFLLYSLIAIFAASRRENTVSKSSSAAASIKFDGLAIVLGLVGFYITANWLHSGLSAYL